MWTLRYSSHTQPNPLLDKKNLHNNNIIYFIYLECCSKLLDQRIQPRYANKETTSNSGWPHSTQSARNVFGSRYRKYVTQPPNHAPRTPTLINYKMQMWPEKRSFVYIYCTLRPGVTSVFNSLCVAARKIPAPASFNRRASSHSIKVYCGSDLHFGILHGCERLETRERARS